MIPGFRVSFWFRVASHYHRNPLYWFILRHYHYKYGIELPKGTKVGEGFYLGHFGSIIINGKSIIGKNCTLMQDVTIGMAGRGDKAGVLILLGDSVYIGCGAKVLGKIKIGSNVAIGANAVVTKDIPDNAVVEGVLAKVISFNGSKDYIDFAVE